jgi:molybdopterin-containing oxidoreductase family membrane subunit
MKPIIDYLIGCFKDAGKWYYITLAITLVIGLAGLSNTLKFFEHGHGVSGMSDMVPWGIYISGLAFFIGTSAGATMVGLQIHAFGKHEYHAIGTRAIILAILSIIAAMTCVMMDVGNPFRAMKLPFFLNNPTSLFVISSSSYMGFMTILGLELYFTIKLTLGKPSNLEKKMAKFMAIFAVPYALVVVHSFTGTIFGIVKAREMWNTPLIPIHFVTSALASGFALVLLVAVLTAIISKKDLLNKEAYNHAGWLLAFFLMMTLFIDVFDYIILLYNATHEGLEVWHLLTGRYIITFAMNMGLMTLALVIVLFKFGRTRNGLLASTVLTILAIGAYRINIISVGQLVPLYGELGELEYIPTIPEIAILVGIFSMLIFGYLVLIKLIPLEDEHMVYLPDEQIMESD